MNHNAATSPPAPAEAPGPGALPVRRLNNPYFVLKTPDNVSDYYDRFNSRVVKSAQEPLARMLADVEDTREGRTRQVSFRLGAGVLPNLRPLKYLTLSEVEAFEKAARAFYDKAHPDKQITHNERELRKNFKLPDPDKEPDAYWVYGDRFAPKLIILWGCEAARNTSIPLIEDGALGIANAPTVAQKLRARLLSWEHLQREALELIATTNDPLGRFLAFPIVNSKGDLVAIEQHGIKIPIDKFRRLKSVPVSEVNEFDQAAKEFYRQAHPAKCDCELCSQLIAEENAQLLGQQPAAPPQAAQREVGAYEKEVRRSLRLPDIDRLPKSYWIYGSSLTGRLLILCPRTDEKQQEPPYRRFEYQKDDCLCLTADPVLSLPVPAPHVGAGEQVAEVFKESKTEEQPAKPHTVTAKLRLRQISWSSVLLKAAAVLIAVALVALAGKVFWPKRLVVLPPAAVNDSEAIDPNNERNVIVVTFNNVVSPKSLAGAAAARPGARFALESPGAAKATNRVISAVRDARLHRTVILKTDTPLSSRYQYTLTIQGVKDVWGNTLSATNVPVSYRDKRPPLFRAVKALREGNNKLLAEFNEPIHRLSAEVATNYSIAGFTLRQATLREDRISVVLETTAPFSPNTTYTGAVQRVADLAGNAMPLTFFTFTPKVEPPRIKQVLANSDQRTLRVAFDAAIDAGYAQSPANYAFDHDLKATNAAVVSPDMVELRLTKPFLMSGVDYKLTATVKDAAGWGGEDSRVFQYTGSVDAEAPRALPPSLTPDDKQVILPFTEPIDGASLAGASFRLFVAATGANWVAQSAVPNVTAGPKENELTFAFPDKLYGKYQLQFSGVQDLVGNTQPGAVEFNTTIVEIYPQLNYVERTAGNKGIIIKLVEELDPSSFDQSNFSLIHEDPAAKARSLINVTEVRYEFTAPLTTVTLKSEGELPGGSYLLWANVKRKGGIRIYPVRSRTF